MSYVKTKDGKIYKVEKRFPEYGNNDSVLVVIDNRLIDLNAMGMVEKQADSIEELCDEYVIFCKEEPNGKLLYYKGFENLKKEFIDFERDKEKVVVYGAIWTDKGLIYVAKMNEKGEWELL